MLTAIFQILCLCCDLAAVLYLFGVLSDHAGTNWHGARSLIKLSAGLLVLIAGSIVLRFVGYAGIALFVAALPILLAAVVLGFVFLVSSTSSWH
jgi:hypothetical protein